MNDRDILIKIINNTSEGHVENLLQPYGAETLADNMIQEGVSLRHKLMPLTAEEMKNMPEIVWCEYFKADNCEPRIPLEIDFQKDYYVFTDGTWEFASEYNFYWRCWAEKPTDQERLNAKWMTSSSGIYDSKYSKKE